MNDITKNQRLIDKMLEYAKSFEGTNTLALAFLYNKIGLEKLRLGLLAEGISVLKEALSLGSAQSSRGLRIQILSITWNNLACMYKCVGMPHTAMMFLRKALKVSQLSDCPFYLASTHLNISAIFSALKNHYKACSHTSKALKLLIDSGLSELKCLATFNLSSPFEYLDYQNAACMALSKVTNSIS